MGHPGMIPELYEVAQQLHQVIVWYAVKVLQNAQRSLLQQSDQSLKLAQRYARIQSCQLLSTNVLPLKLGG